MMIAHKLIAFELDATKALRLSGLPVASVLIPKLLPGQEDNLPPWNNLVETRKIDEASTPLEPSEPGKPKTFNFAVDWIGLNRTGDRFIVLKSPAEALGSEILIADSKSGTILQLADPPEGLLDSSTDNIMIQLSRNGEQFSVVWRNRTLDAPRISIFDTYTGEHLGTREFPEQQGMKLEYAWQEDGTFGAKLINDQENAVRDPLNAASEVFSLMLPPENTDPEFGYRFNTSTRAWEEVRADEIKGYSIFQNPFPWFPTNRIVGDDLCLLAWKDLDEGDPEGNAIKLGDPAKYARFTLKNAAKGLLSDDVQGNTLLLCYEDRVETYDLTPYLEKENVES